MLRQRILTAVPLAAGVVAGILFLSPIWLAALFVAVVMLGAFEWAALAGVTATGGRWLFALAVGVGAWLTWRAAAQFDALVPILGVAWWTAVQVWMLISDPCAQPQSRLNRVWLISGALTLILCFASLLLIATHGADGPLLLLFSLCIVWAADIGAYFVGRRWGRRKLAPRTSPGKSWEGAVGGLLAVALLALAASGLIEFAAQQRLGFVLIAVCAAVYSVTGDLFESRLKRSAGAKDSGTLLPGHGGILDRIDSLTAAAPVFLFGLFLLR